MPGIKPHFLLNALGAISNVCQRDGRKGSQLVDDLAVWVQFSLADEAAPPWSRLDDELTFVQAYVRLEQARYGDRIQMRYVIDAAPDTPVPGLILQPLVENAIRHGLAPRPSGGTVWLEVHAVEGGVCFRISDDGIGMSTEQIAALFQPPQSVSKPLPPPDLPAGRMPTGQTLYHIRQRLDTLRPCSLTLASEPGSGTRVEFILSEDSNHDPSCSY